jgi:imidazoleglycerol-phosphate dehydratase
MAKRMAKVERKTKETDVSLKLNLDGIGNAPIKTGIGFLDHMLALFTFHGLFDLKIELKRGDLEVDIHHTNEDIGIVLGQAVKKALGNKKGIRRFGFASVPMEDVLAQVTLDISGRGHFAGIRKNFQVARDSETKEKYALVYAEHFFDSFSKQAGINLIVEERADPSASAPDVHTALEPIFKAFGLALSQAVGLIEGKGPRRQMIPSTKGIID